MNRQRRESGELLILISAVGFGLSPMLAQLLLQQGLTPEAVALFRFLIPTLIILHCLRSRECLSAEYLRTVLIGAVAGCGMLAYFYCFVLLPATTVILIYYSYPLFAMLIGWFAFRQPMTRNRLIAAAMIMLAVMLMLEPAEAAGLSFWSVMLAFAAPVAFALLLNYFARPVEAIAPRSRMSGSLLGHMLILVPAYLISDQPFLLPESDSVLLLILAIGILAAALPQYLFARGCMSASMERIATFSSTEVVFALLFSALFLGTEIGRIEMIASGLILMAGFIRLEPDDSARLKQQPGDHSLIHEK